MGNRIEIKKVKHFAFFILINVLFPLFVYSQANEPVFKHIKVEEGLSNTNITCIIQDSEGFIWFGTESGLNKYDGSNFIVYGENYGTPNFTGSYIFEIIEDSNHNLWIATASGLNYYNRKLGKFISYLPQTGNSNSIKDKTIRCVIEDHNGVAWFGTKSGRLEMYNKSRNSFSVYKNTKGVLFNPNHKEIADLMEDHLGKIWVLYTSENFIDVITKSRDSVFRIKLTTQDTFPIKQRKIIQDRNHDYWIATLGNGLIKLEQKSKNSYSQKRFVHDPNNPKSLPGNEILTVREDIDSGIWLGIENIGLCLFEPKNTIFKLYKHDLANPFSISHPSVWSVFQDNKKGLWVGTFSTGINYFNGTPKTFKLEQNNLLDENSLSTNIVSSFFVDHSGFLWIGTTGGGLNKYDFKSKKYKCYNTSNSGISSNAIKAIHEDKKQNIWIATWGGGITVFNPKKNSFKTYNNQNSNLNGNNFSTFAIDKKGVMWAGSYWGNDGICYYDEEADDFHCYTTKNSGLLDNTIYKILPGSDGNLWIATHGGLNKFDPISKVFKSYKHNPNNSNTISHPNVHSIIESHDSLLWMVTAEGLNSFNPKTEVFKHYYKSNAKLPDNNLFGIEEDQLGNLWISLGRGVLVKFNPKTNKYINYNASDGLQSGDFIKNSSYKSADGTIYFGGTNGFNSLKPNKIKDNLFVPKLYFTKLKIFNKVIEPGTKNSPLEFSDINSLDTLVLSYEHSVFALEFSAINYTFPDNTKFAYKLEGFEKDWNYIDNQKSATYTNLEPGTYTFRLKAPYHNGVANEQGKSLTIIITPPYYKTWWFRVLIVLGLIGLIIGFVYIKVHGIKKTNKILEEKVRLRTEEINAQKDLLSLQSDKLLETNTILKDRQVQILEQSEELISQRDVLAEVNAVKDKLFSIIAHDLRGPFGTIRGFAELLKEDYHTLDEETRIMMINSIDSSSIKIFELLEQLLEWSRGQSGKISLTPKIQNIIAIIQKNIDIASDQANSKKITIKLLNKEQNINAFFDYHSINLITRNLLSNAIKFTPLGGLIEINVVVSADKVIVSFKDTGVGIEKENLDKLFKDNNHFSTYGTQNESGTGLGLDICKDFVKENGGKIWVESMIGIGSTFSFSLPIGIECN